MISTTAKALRAAAAARRLAPRFVADDAAQEAALRVILYGRAQARWVVVDMLRCYGSYNRSRTVWPMHPNWDWSFDRRREQIMAPDDARRRRQRIAKRTRA